MTFEHSRIENLLIRAEKLNVGARPILNEEINYVRDKLGVKFSKDFIEISKRYSYEFFGRFDFANFGLDNSYSVIFETLQVRKNIGFPLDSLLLYEDDASVIVLKTMDDPTSPSPVIWCTVEDFYRYCEGVPLEYSHDVFPSFTDFFEFLLKREEEEQQREKQEHKI